MIKLDENINTISELVRGLYDDDKLRMLVDKMNEFEKAISFYQQAESYDLLDKVTEARSVQLYQALTESDKGDFLYWFEQYKDRLTSVVNESSQLHQALEAIDICIDG